MSRPDSPPVDYAPRPRSHRRGQWRRSLLLAGWVAVAGSAFWWGPAVGDHITLLRLQRRCTTYAQPPGHVAFEADEKRALALARSDNRYIALDDDPRPPARDPDVSYVVPEWERFYAAVSPPGMQPAATVFLHERRNSQGEARLVAVHAHRADMNHPIWYLTARVLRPGTLRSKPALLSDTMPWDIHNHGMERIMTGRPDPADLSHFTIEYHYLGQAFTLDGWLRDDDAVVIEPR
jgi:hypothetical protein